MIGHRASLTTTHIPDTRVGVGRQGYDTDVMGAQGTGGDGRRIYDDKRGTYTTSRGVVAISGALSLDVRLARRLC